MPLLSIIIVTHNSASTISACLERIAPGLNAGAIAEIIVFDNASADETEAIVRRGFPSVRWSQAGENRGYAAGANAAARDARGTYLFFINPDAVPGERFVDDLREALSVRSDLDIAGCRLLDERGRRQPAAWALPTPSGIALQSFLPFFLSTALLRRDGRTRQEDLFVSGAGMLVRSSLFRELRGFDENFFMYFEDADLCARGIERGCRIEFLPRPQLVHRGRASYTGKQDRFFIDYYTSRIRYCRKHFSAQLSRLCVGMILTGIALRIPMYELLGIFPGQSEFRLLASGHAAALRALR